MEKIRMLVADDHPIFLDGFCTLVRLKYPQIEIVAAVSNGKEALEKVEELNPDVVLLDIRMPEMDGVEAAGLMKRRRPDTKIIMLTTFNEIKLISGALKAGAMGYILKETPISEVIQNVISVCKGNYLISAQAAEKLQWSSDPLSVDLQYHGHNDPVEHFELIPSNIAAKISGLSNREREILELMLENTSNSRIAEKLFIGENTVRNYVSKIYDVIGIHDRSTLLGWAASRGQG